MSEDLVKVYDLKADHTFISAVQKATLETGDYGLVPEHGLFGSPEWWQAINAGVIPTNTIEGVISRVYMSGHNDWPEFEINDGVDKTSWTREVNERKDDAMYRVGKRVKLKYVKQKFKKGWGSPYSKNVLEIWIER